MFRKKVVPGFVQEQLKGSPLVCLDIGGRGGVQSHLMRFENLLTIDAFDPDEKACEEARKRSPDNINWWPVALGRKTGQADFYITNRPSGSSLYEPDPDMFLRYSDLNYGGISEKIKLDVLSYADFRRKFNRPAPNIIKIDTQGSELDIFRSFAEEDWSELVCIQTEIEFEPMYKDQPLFGDVDSFLKGKDFSLFDLRTSRTYLTAYGERRYYVRNFLKLGTGRNDINGKLIAGDALYFRKFPGNVPPSREQVFKLMLCYLTYCYYDYALELSENARQKGLLTAQEAQALNNMIVGLAPRAGFMERAGRIYDIIRKILKRVKIYRPYRAFWIHRYWPNQ